MRLTPVKSTLWRFTEDEPPSLPWLWSQDPHPDSHFLPSTHFILITSHVWGLLFILNANRQSMQHIRICSLTTCMFLRLLYNIKSVLNVYYFANHNFYLCYKILKEKHCLLRKIFLIFKANRLPSMARWHNGYYSLTYQIRPFPLERNHLPEVVSSNTPQLEVNVLSTVSFLCTEKVTGPNR